jgi:hypothetical protein
MARVAFAWDAWINFPFFSLAARVPSHMYKPKRLGTRQKSDGGEGGGGITKKKLFPEKK